MCTCSFVKRVFEESELLFPIDVGPGRPLTSLAPAQLPCVTGWIGAELGV
jgi:hypothetical protein